MEDLKEKMLCALKKNADELYGHSLNTEVGRIWINKDKKYKIKKCKAFWIFPYEYDVFDGCNYTISLGNSTFDITEEEYQEIMKIREEKIREKQLEELEKLCNGN